MGEEPYYLLFSNDEVEELKSCVITVINEGFTTPPYRDIFYDVIEKLGITQEEARQYNISRPSNQKVKKCDV